MRTFHNPYSARHRSMASASRPKKMAPLQSGCPTPCPPSRSHYLLLRFLRGTKAMKSRTASTMTPIAPTQSVTTVSTPNGVISTIRRLPSISVISVFPLPRDRRRRRTVRPEIPPRCDSQRQVCSRVTLDGWGAPAFGNDVYPWPCSSQSGPSSRVRAVARFTFTGS